MNAPRPPLDQEAIVEAAHRELAKLTAELERAVVAVRAGGDWDAVAVVLVKMRHLRADAQLAGIILGMLSPWIPTVADVPAGTPNQVRAREPVELGIRALDDLVYTGRQKRAAAPEDRWRFPDLDDAVQWLTDQQAVVSRDELFNLQQELHREAFTLDTDDLKLIGRFRDALAESLREGESLPEFRKRVGDVGDLTRSQVETSYRTNTKQAFLAGQTKSLEQPRVRDRFRWVYYASTSDNRTRPSHWALDGMVAEIGTSLHRLFLTRQAEYNCRCTLIPLDESKAEGYGVSTIADVPAEYRS